jgi:NADH:ubiquinone oxidoreductase subunit 6 (subunit J)
MQVASVVLSVLVFVWFTCITFDAFGKNQREKYRQPMQLGLLLLLLLAVMQIIEVTR